jgi:GNAT superfamily N-acetyltransferase
VADDTPLASGYGPGTPVADNLCNDFVQETATSFAALAKARGDRVAEIDGVGTLWDAGSPLPFFNRATLQSPVTDLDRVLDALRDFYRPAAGAPFLVDSAWPTPDLRPHGFALMGHPPLMLRPPEMPLSPGPPELVIARVDDDKTARDYEHVLIYGYPAPQLQPATDLCFLLPGTLDTPGWHHFVGYVDGRAVTSGSAYVGDALVRVDNIATLEDARGRGYGYAITAAACATDLTKPAALVASDLGRPVYERLGFRALLRVCYWIGMRDG